jgi:flagellum-specific ATP synthase
MGYLSAQLQAVASAPTFALTGTVQGISGLTIEAVDLPAAVGTVCAIRTATREVVTAEVIGIAGEKTQLMPLTNAVGISRGDRVETLPGGGRIACSRSLLGRVINGLGEFIDNKPGIVSCDSRRIDGRAAAAMERQNIRTPLATGVRALDGLHTCGRGQRMGIFSGPGVGKSTLLASIAKHTDADVSVIALIGERAREVQEFLQKTLGPDGLRRCVVIVSTSDEAPLMRVRSARIAATIGEYFRDQGRSVLLLMDSLTRLCHAQRQIGLAAKEPPATRGYPPSVFSLLPELLERAGNTAAGSITGFYTVLIEGEDFNEPVADAVKGITDGHILLSRALASRGHYPAIDVLQTISRVRNEVTPSEHQAAAKRVLSLCATYHDIEDLVNIGAYVPGANLQFDLAVQCRAKILEYLQQDLTNSISLHESREDLIRLASWIDEQEKQLCQCSISSSKASSATASKSRSSTNVMSRR